MTRTRTTHLRRLRVPVIVVAVAATAALGAGQAQANHVSCGDTITANTTLDSDLTNCPSNGIVLGADDVTLDLDGHLIDGDGTEFAGCAKGEFCDVGLLNDGHDGVTVKDGAVREFAFGAFIGRARHNRVIGISSSTNVFFGFIIVESARSVVRNSSGSGNPAPEGDGIGLFGSRHIRIVHSSFRRNDLGLHIQDSTGNVIKRNRISGNESFGILMEADRNQVRHNRCARNGTCSIVIGSRNVIARNRIVRGEVGIGVEKGRHNVVARNVIVDSRGDGIYLGLRRPLIGGGNNVVRRNRVRGSGHEAIVVRVKDDHSRLSRNIAIGAGDDGFEIQSRSAKLTGNRARRNADLGIKAVRGVIDGGGNVARHNGDPRQCIHVACG